MPGTEIATDLLTPLGAYLWLREGAGGAFLLESVERGRLGRYSFVGAGSRLVSFEEAETLGEPVVGYLGYDAVARLRADRAAAGGRAGRAGEPLSRPGRAAPLRPRARRRGAAARRRRRPARRPRCPAARRPRGPLEREPSRDEHLRRVERAQEHIREGDVFQVVIAQRATRPTSASAVEIYRALRRVNPSPYLFLLELGDARARGQLAGDRRQVRRPPRRAEPDRGNDRPGRRRRRRPALVGEGPRGAHDARRPRAQRPLARLRARLGAGRALHGARALLARDAPRLGGRRGAARRDHAVRAAARDLPGRHRLGRAEGARDADHLGARAATGAASTRARSATASRRTGELDTCIAIRTLWLRDGVAHLQAGGGIVADSDPAAEHEECLAKLRALEAAIELAESEQDAAP